MATAPLDSLCAVCAKLDFKLESRLPRSFYKSLQLLENSARSGCHLCVLIFTSLVLQNQEPNSWRKEADGPVKCSFKDGGEPHLLVEWKGWLNRSKLKLFALPSPRLLRQSSIAVLPQASPSLLQHNKIEASPSSPLLFVQISKWLNSCIETHQKCRHNSSTILPRRVIDVGTLEEHRDPYLLITNGKSGKYVALSYRWGTSPTLTTTFKSIASHMKGMKLETMPKTLRDAILVTRALGFRYIWIDALCIIQDSPQDWVEQAEKMARIYQDAELTVYADGADGSDSGFLADRNLQAIRSCNHTRARMTICPQIPPVFQIIDLGNLSLRGWILQERIFSRRIIHWTHLEVGWECREMQASERNPQGEVNTEWPGSKIRDMLLPTKATDLGLKAMPGMSGDVISFQDEVQDIKTEIYNSWYRLIEEYSRRHLTYPGKDKLVAISSIAKSYHERYSQILGPEESYISGLWKGDLARGLSFEYGTGSLQRERVGLPLVSECNLEDPASWKYRPPSFSWTMGEGQATWTNLLELGKLIPEYNVEVLDVHSITTGGNRWGPVENCRIVLRGVVCPREVMLAQPRSYSPDEDMPSLECIQREFYIRLNVNLTEDGVPEQRWLMIHPVGETGEYRRIGIANIVGDFYMNVAERTSIKLI